MMTVLVVIIYLVHLSLGLFASMRCMTRYASLVLRQSKEQGLGPLRDRWKAYRTLDSRILLDWSPNTLARSVPSFIPPWVIFHCTLLEMTRRWSSIPKWRWPTLWFFYTWLATSLRSFDLSVDTWLNIHSSNIIQVTCKLSIVRHHPE